MIMWRLGRTKVYFMVVMVMCLGYTFFELDKMESEMKAELKSRGITIIDYKEPDKVQILESNSGEIPQEKKVFDNQSISEVQNMHATTPSKLSAENIPESNKVFYNRVPKCGSTTTLNLITKLSALHNFTVINHIKPKELHYLHNKTKVTELTQEMYDLPEPGLYIRHLHFFNFDEESDVGMPKYINIIRDPIEQFISNYYYIRNGFVNENRVKGWELDHLLTPGTKNESLKTCIKLVKLAELDNTAILRDCKKVYSDMIPFFCGSHQWCRKRDAAALEQAKSNIEKYYSAVGVLEDMESSLKLFEKALPGFFGGALEFYEEDGEHLRKISKTASKDDDEETEVKEYLREKLGNEVELYNFVVKRMKTKLGNL